MTSSYSHQTHKTSKKCNSPLTLSYSFVITWRNLCFVSVLPALSHFSDSILEYLANLDKAPDPTVRKDTFSSEIYAAFDILFNNWLQSRESKVSSLYSCAFGINSCSVSIERSCVSREAEVRSSKFWVLDTKMMMAAQKKPLVCVLIESTESNNLATMYLCCITEGREPIKANYYWTTVTISIHTVTECLLLSISFSFYCPFFHL